MRIGHVDGRNDIYDEEGQLIPREIETILYQNLKDTLDVSEGSSVGNMKSLYGSTAQEGALYITSERIASITKPDPLLAAKYDAYPLGMADAVANAYKAWDLKRKNAFEYCEIDLAEIEGFWVKKRTYGVLFLKSQLDVTRKAIMYRRGDADDKFVVLKELLSKRLSVTAPENRKGTFVIGAKYPFLGRGRKRR